MAGTHSAAGVRDNSITALLAQLSGGNREGEVRLIPQICKELRRLADHSCNEIAVVLYVSERTTKCDRSMARTWLKRELPVKP
jgi:hypothetical protein